MNTKKVSKQTEISADTIRCYERIGLLPRVTHSKSGARDFSERGIATLESARRFRKAGMSVESLIECMALVEGGDGTEETRMTLLGEQRGRLAERIAELQGAHDRLSHKIENYQNIILKKEQALFGDDENEQRRSK